MRSSSYEVCQVFVHITHSGLEMKMRFETVTDTGLTAQHIRDSWNKRNVNESHTIQITDQIDTYTCNDMTINPPTNLRNTSDYS